MANAWYLAAQTKIYKDLNSEWQLDIYIYTGSWGLPVKTLELTKDRFKLRRGSSSVKHKFSRILNTQIDFSIYDIGRWLQNLIAGQPESIFKGILKKDGNVFFAGHLTAYLSHYDITKPDTVLRLKLYDGLTRLKNMKDFSSFSADIGHLSEVLFGLLDSLPFGLNLYIYTNLYQEANLPAHHLGIKVKDYLAVKSGASYYDVLDMILTQFQFRLFQENGFWHIQQVISIVSTDPPIFGVKRELITVAGSQSDTRISVKNSFVINELEWAPNEFDVDPFGEFDLTVKCYGPKDIPYQYAQKEYLQWDNPFFNTVNHGWTVDLGTVKWASGSLQIDPGGQVSQVSGQLAANEAIIISFSVMCIRMILQNTDRLDHTLANQNPLFEIRFIGDNSTTYYLRRDNYTWDTTSSVWNKFGIDIFGFDIYDYTTLGFKYAEEYSAPTLKNDLEIITPATSGKIKVLLYGGTAPTQNITNFPYQITAQHNYFNVLRKKTNNNPSSIVPSNFVVSSKVDNPINIKAIVIPFHDKDPYVNVHIWIWYDDPADPPNRWISCNGNWSPLGKPLLEYLAEELVQFNIECNKGIDIKFLRGKNINFINLFSGDIYNTGTTYYYLPCYEESELIEDKKRYVCLLHERKNYTLTTRYQYVMGMGSTTQEIPTSQSPRLQPMVSMATEPIQDNKVLIGKTNSNVFLEGFWVKVINTYPGVQLSISDEEGILKDCENIYIEEENITFYSVGKEYSAPQVLTLNIIGSLSFSSGDIKIYPKFLPLT